MMFFLMFAFQTTARCENAIRYGLLVTVLQDPLTLGSRVEIEKLVKFANENGIDTIFIQIYRANKSYFPSKVGTARHTELV